jgi:multiple sugar transport system permease protein
MTAPVDQATRDRRLGLMLISPSVIVFAALIVYPLLDSIWLSLQHADTVTRTGDFVGLANYQALLTDSEFWISLANTFVWTASAVTLQVVAGVGVALLLHQTLWFRSLARGLILFPYLLPTIVAVLVWKWLLNDLYGELNALLMDAHVIDMPLDWLGSMPNAMIGVVLVGVWKYFPFVVLNVLARLQSIPEALYEAARIDGAGPVARFFDITLPQLRGVLGVVILLRAIWDFKEFDLIFLLTGGGPVIGTQTLPLMVYKFAFPLQQMGMASAVAVLMMAIMLVFMLLYLRRADPDAGS